MLKPSELSFQSLVNCFDKALQSRARERKDRSGQWLHKFCEISILPYRKEGSPDGDELYQVYRLLLPGVRPC